MVAISPILIASYLLAASNDSTGGRGVTRRIGTRGAAAASGRGEGTGRGTDTDKIISKQTKKYGIVDRH